MDEREELAVPKNKEEYLTGTYITIYRMLSRVRNDPKVDKLKENIASVYKELTGLTLD